MAGLGGQHHRNIQKLKISYIETVSLLLTYSHMAFYVLYGSKITNRFEC